MKYLILIMLVACGAMAAETPACVRVLRLVAESHAGFTSDDLGDYLASPPGSNPIGFASALSPLKKFAFEKGWHNAAEGDPRADAATREEARRLLSRQGREEERREKAETKTSLLPVPVMLKTLPEKLTPPMRADGAVVRIAGEPFVAFGTKTEGIALVDAKGDFVTVGAPDSSLTRRPVGFHWRGKDYLAHTDTTGLKIYDLATHRLVTRELLPDVEILRAHAAAAAAYDTAEGTRLIVGDARSSSWVVLPVGSPPGQGEPAHDGARFNVNYIRLVSHGGVPRLFAWEPGPAFSEIDPISAATRRRFPTKDEVIGVGVYPSGNGLKAFVNTRGGLSIVDLTTGVEKPIVADGGVWGMPTVFSTADGHWFATSKAVGEDAFALVDLQTESVVGKIPAQGASTPMRSFTGDGRTYLAWGSEGGNVSVIDPFGHPAAVRARLSGGTPYDLVPFETRDGGVRAVVVPFDKPPSLIQLFGAKQ